MTAGSHKTALSAVHASDETDGVVVLTLNHPPANALSNSLVSDLTAKLETLANGPHAPALVLTGAGERFFCAGGDMKEAVDFDADSMAERMKSFHALLCALENYPRPLVCAVNGWCVGGGIEMALFADVAYASTTARFVFPEIKHGMLPAVKGIAQVREILGDRAARRLLLGGEPIDAFAAKAMGIVDQVVKQDDLLATALADARKAAAKPPAVFAALKRALHSGTASWPVEEQLRVTVADARTVFIDPAARDAREGFNG
ncbi:enoyl-CoA hydratase/isomerase family protein [Streptomyces sp. NBC_00063]|jgi:enoyl-CoA hydratase/carnithine racemase|uniref:enoyl-CoA hydratase/isomerase family protein n=1 Tax=Streptomyces sp. NBC_00063 TaxID=2975638 RepID=UPI002256E3AE|nr:enoyl-CoA hydratase/isomerase family protein [Streptomyces sp. NBC_00063]MCX5443839.1 enoyl-CoA hydratase/isomerase family protein [Streptomyces sp. NBC_00063]